MKPPPSLSSSATRPARFRFGELTEGNCVAITVDGKDTFEQVYDHMLRAKRSILIANYDLDPHLRFARAYPGASLPDGNNSTSRHHPDIIRSACTRPLVTDSIAPESRRYTLQDLLMTKAKEEVEVKIIVWQPRLALRILPGADERGIDGRADDVEVLNAMAKSVGIGDRLQVLVDDTAPTITSAHHEKIMVIDETVGFCGGLDLSNGKWDTSAHEYESALRDHNAEPWHDVQVMARGPVVWDMVYHFRQRWHFAQGRDKAATRRLKLTALPPLAAEPASGRIPAVALRTWKEMERNGGIKAWYAQMFRKAMRSIYIENQFPFQSKALTRLLLRRLQEQPRLKVVVVGPMEPNLPGLVGSMLSKMSVNDVNKNLARLRKVSEGRVATYSLVSQHRMVPTMRKQIYVHSKVMVVDDEWMTVGSANLDKNGTDDSSEFNLGISSQALAQKTRVRLWLEHTGGGRVPRSHLVDFDEGFDVLKKLARENGLRVQQSKPIIGSIYCYNFDEEGLPAPYPGAPGGNRFALL